MKPEIIINVPLNSGEIEEWGLAYDDHCVVMLRRPYGEPTWMPWSASYIPGSVARFVSALYLDHEALSKGFAAAFHVANGNPGSTGERPAEPATQVN